MNNTEIAKKFKLTAKLMELHGENDFKVRSYQKVVDIIKGMDDEFSEIDPKKITEIEGIGKGTADKILSMLETESFESLDQLLAQTPEGVVEMLGISGFGPKKIAVLWKETGVETLDDLLVCCLEDKVAPIKGFGEKSQETLKKAVEFKIDCRGKLRYAEAEAICQELVSELKQMLPEGKIGETGAMRRRMDVVSVVEILVGFDDFDKVREAMTAIETVEKMESLSGPFSCVAIHIKSKVKIRIRLCKAAEFDQTLMKTTGSARHLNAVLHSGRKLSEHISVMNGGGERSVYEQLGMAYVEPELREGKFELELAQKNELPTLVEMSDLKGILHNHSTYSDGKHTLRQMAEYCKSQGYEYLGITDHSQTAVYASGLQEFSVKQQQDEIQKLNEELAPFKIFSGIESDILADGSLDYPDAVLESFDFIVSSVHSSLNMDINKATNRLLAAIKNPYTTILGHMTGRLLLEREGYPVDHKEIIHACAENNVVIEINASPFRLDIDWRWVRYAIEQGVMLSVNPDAHSMKGYDNMYYGLLAGRKGGLTKEKTLNAMSLSEIEFFFTQRKVKIKA